MIVPADRAICTSSRPPETSTALGGIVPVSVTRGGSPCSETDEPLTVPYNTSGGTATAGEDYTAVRASGIAELVRYTGFLEALDDYDIVLTGPPNRAK